MQHYPSILEKFYHYERQQPKKLFLSEPVGGKAQEHSWSQAGQTIRRMAAALLDLKLAAGSRIAIIGKNSPHWIMADLAIMMAGHVSVPIYPTVTAATLEQILLHSESQLYLSASSMPMNPFAPESLLLYCRSVSQTGLGPDAKHGMILLRTQLC